jgi:hypothetical protein
LTFTPLPRGLNELLAPLCRFCRRLLRNACSEAVSDGELDVVEVVPPKSVINLENAEFKFAKALEERFAGAPAAVDVALTTWLLLKSLISAVSSAAIPYRP